MKKIANLRVFPTILAGMIVGISFIIMTDLWLPIAAVAAAFVVAVAGGIALYKKSRRALRSAAVFSICFVLGIAFGLSAAAYANARLEKREIFEESAAITGKIEVGNSSDLSGKVDSYTVVLTDITVNGEKADGKAELYSLQLKDGGFYEGDVISFTGRVVTLSTDVTTSYKASSLAEGIIYDITCPDDETGEIEVVGRDLDFFDKIKKAVAAKLADNAGDKAARFMYAMTFGDSAVIEESMKSDFSYTGTAHLLAVSGLHVGILAGALYTILKAIKVNAAARSAIVLAALVFFSALCGFSPSTVRATVMVAVAAVAGLLGLRYDPLSGMSLAAIILLFVSPFNLYSLGFLMSFVAVYGLILFAKPLERAFLKAKFPKWLSGALSATLSANATLLPIMIYVFGDVSLISVPANCIIVPLAGIFFPLYIFALPFSFIPYFGFVATVVSLPFAGLSAIVGYLAGIDFPSVYFDFNWATIVLWLVAATTVSGLCAIPGIAKKIIASVLVICFISEVIVENAGMLSGADKITCFSSYDCAGVLVRSEKEGDFIVFHGEIDEAAVEAALGAMDKSRLRKVNFIVKFGFSETESEILDDYAEELGADTVYTTYASFTKYATGNFIMLADVASVICTYGYSAVYFDGVDLVIADKESPWSALSDCDILVCPYLGEKPDGVQYLVDDHGCSTGAENCLPSDFTFWTEGGKIVKTYKWRFA